MALRLPLLTFTVLILAIVNAFAADIKDIRFSFKHAAPVVFSHASHLSQYNNNCKICHDAIFNTRERRRFTMIEMEKSKSCGACHSGVKAFSVASEKDCVLCHKGKVRNVTYKVKGAGETIFSHAKHLSATQGACKKCHNGTVISGKAKAVTMAEMEKGQSCGACHNGKPTFTVSASCDRCHKGFKPAGIPFKTEAGEVTFSHDNHLNAYKCNECHTKIFPYKAGTQKATMAEMEQGKSCGACHNKGKDAFPVQGDCDKCHKM